MSVKWIKTGKESEAIAKQDEKEKEQQEAQRGKLWRFFLKDKEEARITFIDGDLDENGHLSPPRFYEHNLQINGKWGNTFVCPEKSMPEEGHKCPICATGDRSSLVALFTIIDHREFKTKQGKTMSNQKRLLVAKSISMEMLTKHAIKRGGLAGTTWDVTRMGDNSAAIGSMFDFVEKNEISFLQKQFTEVVDANGVKKQQTIFLPADYEKEIVFHTPEELLKLGFGTKTAGGMGTGMSPGGSSAKHDYSSQL